MTVCSDDPLSVGGASQQYRRLGLRGVLAYHHLTSITPPHLESPVPPTWSPISLDVADMATDVPRDAGPPLLKAFSPLAVNGVVVLSSFARNSLSHASPWRQLATLWGRDGAMEVPSLDLADNALGEEGVAALGRALVTPPIRPRLPVATLCLCGCGLADTDIEVLAPTMASIATLRPGSLSTLDLSRNQLTDSAIATFVRCFSSVSPNHLCLASNELRDDGCHALEQWITASYEGERLRPRLTSLDLSDNHITSHGAQPLAHALPLASCLTALSLRDNVVDVRGIDAVRRALPTSHIDTVWLSGNCLDTQQTAQLATLCSEGVQQRPCTVYL
mmetsp:Transcript_23434/g.55838  ORF Transcript_23434/g.55838 Transcript_23434/m.55838 type:complete len:333 (+) Transcript_23434:3-1001(+)